MMVPGLISHGMKTPNRFLVPSQVITMSKSRSFTKAGTVTLMGSLCSVVNRPCAMNNPDKVMMNGWISR